jgi:hypothetical protein
MSEYQYYEFRTIDRPLTDRQMRELRAVSTRAVISRTTFSNHYEYGDLKATRATYWSGTSTRRCTLPTGCSWSLPSDTQRLRGHEGAASLRGRPDGRDSLHSS